MDPQQDVIELPDKHPLRIRAEKAESQRDELLSALKEVRGHLTAPFVDTNGVVRLYVKAIVTIQDAITNAEGRCDGRYPVPQTSPARDEPFDVTYRCALPTGHAGPHGPNQEDK